jgi:hypothetical protein
MKEHKYRFKSVEFTIEESDSGELCLYGSYGNREDLTEFDRIRRRIFPNTAVPTPLTLCKAPVLSDYMIDLSGRLNIYFLGRNEITELYNARTRCDTRVLLARDTYLRSRCRSVTVLTLFDFVVENTELLEKVPQFYPELVPEEMEIIF